MTDAGSPGGGKEGGVRRGEPPVMFVPLPGRKCLAEGGLVSLGRNFSPSELSNPNQGLLHLFQAPSFSYPLEVLCSDFFEYSIDFYCVFYGSQGIVGCSDTASMLWMSPVAKKQTPEVSLNTQPRKAHSSSLDSRVPSRAA